MIGEWIFEPLIPWSWWGGFAVIALVLLVWMLIRRARGSAWRALVLLLLLLALAGPRAQWQEREPLPDIALMLIDQSASQELENRRQQTEEAVARLRQTTGGLTDLEWREVRVGDDANGDGTRVAVALRRAMADLPPDRFAGAVLVTDGQDRDPSALADQPLPGPVHLLLTGRPHARDRRIEITAAPAFGMVDKTVPLTLRVLDPGAPPNSRLSVTLRLDGQPWQTIAVRTGREQTLDLPLSHAGPLVVEAEVPTLEGEVSALNNRAARVVTGVRDRLQVLLVSGRPHPGQRVWRNLLKSDPGVDLVHFTILRPASRIDPTPLRELALISFPTQELFEERLDDFDLVIFDRYVVRHLMAPEYYRNLVDYVETGGAFLLAAGPEFAGEGSPAATDLGDLLPALPETGRVLEQPYRPRASKIGLRHPVTEPLRGSEPGRWHRIIAGAARRGEVVMEGPDDLPLLILDRQGDGRVALMLSDQVWLWARGHDGGGPHGELLRRLIHWLMKEPDLEEERLTARMIEGELRMRLRTLEEATKPQVRVIAPDGSEQRLAFETVNPGRFEARLAAPLPGTYQVTSGSLSTLAVGPETPEFGEPRATAEKLAPLVERTGGAVVVLNEEGIPAIQRRRVGGAQKGRGWIGLQRNGVTKVTGARDLPLLPGLLFALVMIGGLGVAWWREGR
ncbi:hypothetical protein [Magnetospira sp. QH-2]|uniref:hypothetical protein n=1 Tax=Magnetospira sp. (strain QH-2) TaxID=1288970 RepID=UPI0003E81728|nr:hypothetical protein [Magnetospira sp. QH-2]CCQ72734.1 conserved membrane protein of unknown function [Magnetospira sp. QH-2]